MKTFFSKKKNRILSGLVISFLIIISIFIAGKPSRFSQNSKFERFTRKLFEDEICSNTLNLHYTLAYPQKYGIKDYEISLGTMDPEILKQNGVAWDTLKQKLERFSRDELSKENQIIYDMLLLDTSLQSSVREQYLLQEPLGPNLGIQAQLPTLLAEYTFRVPKDIKDYFSLLSCIPEYFDSILKFEKEKSEQGLFMSDTTAERIIQQCNTFVSEKKNHFLTSMFTEKLDTLTSGHVITKKQASSYKTMHEKLMKESVFPSYEALASGLEKLKGTGHNSGGLAYLDGGTQYYEYLVKTSTGDFRTIKEIEQDLSTQLLRDYQVLHNLQQKDPGILSKASGIPASSPYSPQEMLDYLNQNIHHDFPELTVNDYEIKYVPKALEQFSSPAFYLTPPLDTLSPNTIYINKTSQVSCAELFTTLAHEGFPGHLYQTLYFGKQNPAPIREFLGCSGYIEGWATYVESLAYGYAAQFLNIEPDVMEFLNRNRSVNLCLYSLLDIGIHHKGWTLPEVMKTLSSLGIPSEDTCKEIYQYIVENPANYLKYYLGYLNFVHLREQMEQREGSRFDLKTFHQNLLEIGPAPFPIVKKYLLLRYTE